MLDVQQTVLPKTSKCTTLCNVTYIETVLYPTGTKYIVQGSARGHCRCSIFRYCQ